jgi:hypothetical protein
MISGLRQVLDRLARLGRTFVGQPIRLRSGQVHAALLGIALAIGTERFSAQQLDICGCANAVSLGAFDTSDPATWPPGLVVEQGFRRMVLGLPADGVLVFESVLFKPRSSDTGSLEVLFAPNARNTPVTLLVKGDLTFENNTFLNLSGSSGVGGGAGRLGGAGGPGGFHGGDAAYPQVDLVGTGGAGLGPLGGAPGGPGPSGLSAGSNGQFVGNQELLPMIGGSGAGGGGATSALNCWGGGGGGGGGAILISANGTVTMGTNTTARIFANGGNGGSSSSSCGSRGGEGAGGSIRVVAATITGAGSFSALGGSGSLANAGRVRLEAVTNTMQTSQSTPLAVRSQVPGPPAAPITPLVSITRVGGIDAPALPTGNIGGVDITLPVPGSVQIEVATSGVPSGTTVEIYVKPRLGGPQSVLPVTLAACGGDGTCSETASTTLAAGRYTIEARATFQTP